MKRPDVKTGDIVKIHRKIKEGDKERVQVFEGIVVAVKGKQSSSPMITVRKVSFGVGVEITVPVFSPPVSKIEIMKHAEVRRSKLYYLRRKDYRISKMKTKDLEKFVAEEPARPPASTDEAFQAGIAPPAEIGAGKEKEEKVEQSVEAVPEEKKGDAAEKKNKSEDKKTEK